MKQIYLCNFFLKPMLIDDCDEVRVRQHKWYLNDRTGQIYCSIYKNGKTIRNIYIGRYILEIDDPLIIVDHKDRDKFNNLRTNLRITTTIKNNFNKSKMRGKKYKGVFLNKRDNIYYSKIAVGKQQIYLGRFKTEIEAARAYDLAAKRYHKDFACLNFPEE